MPLPPTFTTAPNVARMYDYFLGGKENFAADRAMAEKVLRLVPQVRTYARLNREFLVRATLFLAGEAGITQFVDIGSGLPTQRNVHEVAQQIAPGARVVYVDNDPMVLVHARALLATDAQTRVADADLRKPSSIVGHREVLNLIDWSKPVAVLLVAVLHSITDTDDPRRIIGELCAAMAPGSYLVISHVEQRPELVRAADLYRNANAPVVPRTAEEIAALLSGLDLVEPGLVRLPLWRPRELEMWPEELDAPLLGAVGRVASTRTGGG
ncbi:SAM-dependent methyltransferase [Microtetraspora malaysiensis]|uniref:SAM-dependent methyltransferase n=1 Tax=Microtetraspora malaysiensis TaxID=161358 RepID=UPI001C3F4391|nr:SAM-dependent methyltransferase [Microtetraspora malaysiensis]